MNMKTMEHLNRLQPNPRVGNPAYHYLQFPCRGCTMGNRENLWYGYTSSISGELNRSIDNSYLTLEEEYENPETVKYHILPNDSFDESVFTEDELRILNRVVDKFKYMKVTEIVEYMHQESAYVETQPDELISYELAKEIRAF